MDLLELFSPLVDDVMVVGQLRMGEKFNVLFELFRNLPLKSSQLNMPY
eukprot:s5424_g1.t1